MTAVRRRRRMVPAAVVVAAVVAGIGWPVPVVAEHRPTAAEISTAPSAVPTPAAVPSAPPAPGQPLTPGQSVSVDGFGADISPDLAAVAVHSKDLSRATAARERAFDVLTASTARKQQAVDRLRALDLELGRANEAVTDAMVVLSDAQAVLVRAEAVLARRNTEAATAEGRLVAAQKSLQEVAIATYIQPDNDKAWMSGDPADLLDAASARVLFEVVGGDRIDRVTARKKDLQAARTAVVVATEQVAANVKKVADRTAELAGRKADVVDTRQRIEEAHTEDRAADQAIVVAMGELASAQIGVADARVLAEVEGADFPLVALDAYWRAAKFAPCKIEWWALAGIGQVESQHGTYRGASLDARGVASPAIIGIPLNGENNTAVIRDSDGGALDFDTVFDRAVGPMQFIPSTWRAWEADGNSDSVMSPHDLYDVAMAAGRYLCAAAYDLTVDSGLRTSYFTYNFSIPYVEQVLGYARGYQSSVDIPSPEVT